ncbi:MAG TPA: glycosyltransferase family 4 protein [Candidatus Sulfotelmatobacter sp.]|nr:glycosyltransferase family 4 protein [Candidatus Sulfotelmatobacter sp.]
MKILWVKAGKLWPVDTGGKIRSFNILRHLARNHEATLLSYYGGRRDGEYETAIAKQLPGAQTIYTAAPEGTIAQSIDYILRLPSSAPYAVKKFTNPLVRREVARRLSDGSAEVAVCDFLSASLNFPEASPTAVVLFQHNVETMLWQRMADTEKSALRKLSYQIEARKMAAYETGTLRRFHQVIAVSEHDRKHMLALAPGCAITVVPTGVDTEKYQPAPSVSGNPPLIVFTGSMDWEPNIDAVEYFCREIFPSVLAAFPDARFQIVGRNPHSRVRKLASPSVEVTGTVPSVAEYLRNATVVIVPLRIGGGTRLKIFEAMAMRKAMVSTSIGAEGLDVTSGKDCLLADDAPSFAAEILAILRDPTLRRSYEDNAAALAARYDWSQIAKQFAEALSKAAGDPRSQNRPSTAALPV